MVVVNWNGRDLLEPCLSSLSKQVYSNREVILVDNASDDGSVEFVRSVFPWVKIVESSENLGYAGGCNLGVRRATGDYVLLLNNDTRLAPDLLLRLVTPLEHNPLLGAVSAVQVERLDAHPPVSSQPTTINVIGKHLVHTNATVSPFYAPGACCLYRRALSSEPYDSDYFAYDEDVYLSWLLRLKGYHVGVEPQALFEHKTSSTSRRIREYVVFCAERNRWTNLILFYEASTLAKVAPLVVLNVVAKTAASVEEIRPKLRAYLWLFRNLRLLLHKPARIQSSRVVRDSDVIRHMTGRVADASTPGANLANTLSLWYMRALRIPTYDSRREREASRSPKAEAAR